MSTTSERIYQASDLAGPGRKPFIDDALRSRARLRSTTGESLVMLRETTVETLSAVSDAAVALLTLDNALRRTRADRSVTDYGTWAFIAAFEDDDIRDFRDEVSDAIVLAVSNSDSAALDKVIHEWRMSASTLSDPIAAQILAGEVGADDWIEVGADGDA